MVPSRYTVGSRGVWIIRFSNRLLLCSRRDVWAKHLVMQDLESQLHNTWLHCCSETQFQNRLVFWVNLPS
jgi:hypothetical protein